MIYEFAYVAPRTKKDLLRRIEKDPNDTRLLAGGTDLLVNIRLGLTRPTTVMDIKKIAELRKISFDPREGLSIGAAVTITDVIENKTIQKKYPVLIEAASDLASNQIRNRATVIGNICNASPCADMALPLLCLNARVVLSSTGGERTLPLHAFFAGVKKTHLKKGEFCEKVVVPREFIGAKGGFRKLKRIKGHDIGLISACMVIKDKRLRVAIGSAAPTPVLLKELSTRDSVEKVLRTARRAIDPIDDVRCSRDYRIFMAKKYVRDLREELL